jgi:hypothetical protein
VTLRYHDPDAYVLRLQDSGGNGPVGFWVPRLIADHEHPGKSRANCSYMVINECERQGWGFLMDLLWLKKVRKGTTCDDVELSIDSAGILSLLRGEPSGTITRLAVALAAARNEGYVTDGKGLGQLWHLMTLTYKPKPKPKKEGPPEYPPTPTYGHHPSAHPGLGTGGGGTATPAQGQGGAAGTGAPHLGSGPGETVAGPAGDGPGETQTEEAGSGCDEAKEATLALNGDVPFRMGSHNVAIAVGGGQHTLGDIYTGPNWIDVPAPKPPDKRMELDPNNNHEPLPPYIDRGLWNSVRIPRYYCPPTGGELSWRGNTTGGGTGVPTPSTPDAGVVRPPLSSFTSGYAVQVFPSGYRTIVMRTFALPEFTGDFDLRVLIPFRLPTALAGGEQIKLELFCLVVGACGSSMGGTPTQYNATLSAVTPNYAATDLQIATVNVSNVIVPADGGVGGHLRVWLARRSDDSAVGKPLLITEDLRVALKPIGAQSPAFDTRQVEV